MTKFILYSRTYCHLCDDMLDALKNRYGQDYDLEVSVIDVDLDPALVAQYDELVPMLVGVNGGERTELCHYFLDEAAVGAWLKSETVA